MEEEIHGRAVEEPPHSREDRAARKAKARNKGGGGTTALQDRQAMKKSKEGQNKKGRWSNHTHSRTDIRQGRKKKHSSNFSHPCGSPNVTGFRPARLCSFPLISLVLGFSLGCWVHFRHKSHSELHHACFFDIMRVRFTHARPQPQ
jgi:hypothetical protein